ncbi:MAG TPA: hypothetical protein HPP76_08310 [Desulfuromonadales bacterium]|nr:hypothetical protein [Desulfuromonadales bacterium]
MCDAGTNFVPLAEAARLLETTEMRVLMMLKKNELQGSMDEESGWFVDRASLNICGKPQAADVVRPGGCGGGCSSGNGNGSGCGGH